MLLTRGLDNMVSVKVSSVNIVNRRHSGDECVHCPGGRAAGGGDDGDHGAGHHAHQGGPELQTRETGSAAQTVTTHEKLLCIHYNISSQASIYLPDSVEEYFRV